MAGMSRSFSIPKNYQDLEELCVQILGKHWGIANVQRFGRQGHAQSGIDIFGESNGKVYACQVKYHEQGKPLLWQKDIVDQVEKAKCFGMPLHTYIVATTAPADPKLQKRVLTLSAENQANGFFPITVFFWDRLQELMREFSEIAERYEGLDVVQAPKVEQGVGALLTQQRVHAVGGPAEEVDAVLDEAVELMGQMATLEALNRLEDLRRKGWSKSSARQRYRILANLGLIHETLEDTQKAAQLFLEAKDFLPEDMMARCFAVRAFLYLGQHDQAASIAADLRTSFPNNPDAWLAWIAVESECCSCENIEQAIPAHILKNTNISFLLSRQALQEMDFERAECYAKSVLEDNPCSLQAKERLADVHLECVLATRHNAELDPTANARLLSAESLYTSVLENAPSGASQRWLAHMHHKRGLANRFLCRVTQEQRDIMQAYDLDRSQQLHVTRYASMLYDLGRPDEAIDLLRPLFSDGGPPAGVLSLADCLQRRNREGDKQEALRALQRAVICGMAPQDSFAFDVLCKMVQLSETADSQQELMTFFTQLNLFRDDVVCTLRAAMELRLGNRDAAVEAARCALAGLGPETPSEVLAYLGRVLAALDLLEDALAVWKRLSLPTELTFDARARLEVAWKAPDLRYLIEVAENLRRHGVYDLECLDLELAVREQANDLAMALSICDEYLGKVTEPDKLRFVRLRRSHLALQIGDKSAVESDPARLPRPDEFGPHIGWGVVEVLKAGSDALAAVRHAYEVYRNWPESIHAYKAIVSSFRTMEGGHVPIEVPDVAGPGSAILYEDEDTSEQFWCIIEDSPSPSILRQERAPDDPLAYKLQGKHVDDRFVLHHGTLSDRYGTVRQVQSKYVYRYQECLRKWNLVFPDDSTFEWVRLAKPGEDNLDITPIFKSIDMQTQHIHELEKKYKDGLMPLGMFAAATGKTVFDVLHHITQERRVEIACCEGSEKERRIALESLRLARCVVLDPSALATLILTECTWLLGRVGLRCCITEGALRDLRHLDVFSRHEQEGTTFVGKGEQGYTWTEYSPETMDAMRRRLTEAIDDIEAHCDIVSGLSSLDLASIKGLEPTTILGRATAESIAVAVKDGHLLWTDDARLASLAQHEYGCRWAWSQLVAMSAVEGGEVTPQEFDGFVIRLLKLGYNYTALTVRGVLRAAEESAWIPESSPLAEVVAHLAGPKTESAGVEMLAANLIRAAWQTSKLRETAQHFTFALLEALGKRPGGLQIIEDLRRDLLFLFGIDIIRGREALHAVNVWSSTAGKRTLFLP